jgi:hypothetical protein
MQDPKSNSPLATKTNAGSSEFSRIGVNSAKIFEQASRETTTATTNTFSQ